MVHPRGGVQDTLGGVEYEQPHVRGYLEGLPGDRDIFFIDPENPTSGDHQIGDFVCLWTHHEVFDTAESLVLWAAYVGANQFVGPERGIQIGRASCRERGEMWVWAGA